MAVLMLVLQMITSIIDAVAAVIKRHRDGSDLPISR